MSFQVIFVQGTKTEIMTPRKNDKKHRGLSEWHTKSVHNWGEDPRGEWKIDISAEFMRTGLSKAWENMYQTFIKPLTFRKPDYQETGTVHSFTLWFHGTSEEPDHHQKRLVPRTYSAFRTSQGQKSDPLTLKQKRDGGLSSQNLHPSQTARK